MGKTNPSPSGVVTLGCSASLTDTSPAQLGDNVTLMCCAGESASAEVVAACEVEAVRQKRFEQAVAALRDDPVALEMLWQIATMLADREKSDATPLNDT